MTNIGRKRCKMGGNLKGLSPKPKRRIVELPSPALRAQKRSVCVYLMQGLLLAWLFASILFAHGCHGNEDHELFGAWIEWIGK
jgi:hypothetical protein